MTNLFFTDNGPNHKCNICERDILGEIGHDCSEKIMQREICPKCGEIKTLEQFYRNKAQKNGYQWECKECHKKLKREFYQKNSEKIMEERREYFTGI